MTPEQLCRIPALRKDGRNIQEIAAEIGSSVNDVRDAIVSKAWERYYEEPGHPDRCPDCGGMVMDDTQPCAYCSLAKARPPA